MLEGQKCLVIGSGISGIGAVALLEKYHADVVLYDSSDKLTKEGEASRGKQGSLYRRRTAGGGRTEHSGSRFKPRSTYGYSSGEPYEGPRGTDPGRDRTGIPCRARQSDRHYRH